MTEEGPQGPAKFIVLNNEKTLRITIGTGDATLYGENGIERPNPAGPASPLLSAVLTIKFSEAISNIYAPFYLSLEQHYAIAFGNKVRVNNADGVFADIALFFDFPDMLSRLDNGHIVRSNTYGIAQLKGKTFITDASQNAFAMIGNYRRTHKRLITFPDSKLPNNETSEAVPTEVTPFQGDLLLVLESGFPPKPGLSRVIRYHTNTGEFSPFITGLTKAIDILPVRHKGKSYGFYIVELTSKNFGPGRLLYFKHREARPKILSNTLNYPTSVVRDNTDNTTLFVTESAAGNIVAVKH